MKFRSTHFLNTRECAHTGWGNPEMDICKLVSSLLVFNVERKLYKITPN